MKIKLNYKLGGAFDDMDWFLDIDGFSNGGDKKEVSDDDCGYSGGTRSGFKRVDEKEPKNNDGREYCWWCGARTKKVPSPNPATVWDICSNPECGM